MLYRHTTGKKELVYTDLHVKMANLDQIRILQLIRDWFYWPKLEDDVRHFVSKVYSWFSWNQKVTHSISCTNATFIIFSTIWIDWNRLLHLDNCSGGFVQVYTTTNISAKAAADCLYDYFMLRYGIPGKVLHDQGKQFENSLFARISKLCGIKRWWTTPCHP